MEIWITHDYLKTQYIIKFKDKPDFPSIFLAVKSKNYYALRFFSYLSSLGIPFNRIKISMLLIYIAATRDLT